MQNITDFERGVTVSEEPYTEEEREASILPFLISIVCALPPFIARN